MEAFSIVLLVASAAFTLVCAYSYPRSVFGLMLMCGVAYFIAMSFANESKSLPGMRAVGIIGILPFVGIFLWSVLRLAQGSDAWIWRVASISWPSILWQKIPISGGEAWEIWIRQIIGSGLTTTALTVALVANWQRIQPGLATTEKPTRIVDPETQRKKIEEEAFRNLAEQVRPLVAECRRLGQSGGRVSLLGKAVILDLESGKRRQAHDFLPETLRGNPTDKELTLFLIVEKHKTLLATYRPRDAGEAQKEIPGYRVDLDVAIVRWPAKKPVGMVRLKGKNPPESISVNQWLPGKAIFPSAVTGPIDSPLEEWVASRPIAGHPDPVGDALALTAKANGKGEVLGVRLLPQGDKFAYEKRNAAPKLQGKVLIWDVSQDLPLKQANHYLPEKYRGQVSDSELTLFMLSHQNVEVKLREPNGIMDGTAYIEGFIVYWPEKKTIGPFKLTCENLSGTPGEGLYQADGQVLSDPFQTGLYDTSAHKLAKWIASLAGM